MKSIENALPELFFKSELEENKGHHPKSPRTLKIKMIATVDFDFSEGANYTRISHDFWTPHPWCITLFRAFVCAQNGITHFFLIFWYLNIFVCGQNLLNRIESVCLFYSNFGSFRCGWVSKLDKKWNHLLFSVENFYHSANKSPPYVFWQKTNRHFLEQKFNRNLRDKRWKTWWKVSKILQMN